MSLEPNSGRWIRAGVRSDGTGMSGRNERAMAWTPGNPRAAAIAGFRGCFGKNDREMADGACDAMAGRMDDAHP